MVCNIVQYLITALIFSTDIYQHFKHRNKVTFCSYKYIIIKKTASKTLQTTSLLSNKCVMCCSTYNNMTLKNFYNDQFISQNLVQFQHSGLNHVQLQYSAHAKASSLFPHKLQSQRSITVVSGTVYNTQPWLTGSNCRFP